jgi:transcriptional regulator with XRE-family HTH domain
MTKSRRQLSEEELQDAERLRKVWESKSRELNLTQLDVSKAFGFANQSAVSQYLNARIPLNLEAAAKFSKILNVSLTDISPRHAASVVTKSSCSGCPVAVAIPTGSEVIEVDSLAKDMLGDGRWYVLDRSSRSLADGVFLMEVGEMPKLIRIESHEGGYRIIGASQKPMDVTKEVAALLPIKGRVLYKITKV